MGIQTIDDVIGALDGIIDRAWRERSRGGYFAAMYRKVTRAVKDGIAAGRFENGPLLEQLDVVFANRYFEALERSDAGGRPSQSWSVAFEAARDAAPLVLQQLLAGMNAHINFDLGIATQQTAPGDRLPSIESDFNQINAVLAEQVATLEREIAMVSPLIAELEKLDLRTETRLINFSLVKARDQAWKAAVKLNAVPAAARPAILAVMDAEVALLGRLVVSPPPPLNLKLLAIRAAESNDVRQILDILTKEDSPASVSSGS